MSARGTILHVRDACVALCPVLVLAVVRVWLGAGGPATASASGPEPAPAAAEPARFEAIVATEAERAYLARVADLARVEAPDVFPRQEPTVPETVAPEAPSAEPEAVDPRSTLADPDVVVTSIMAGRTPIAIINGRAHKAGDLIAGGWVVASIAEGRVVIVHRTGVTRVLRIARSDP
jgi:hypothetical protein